MCASRIGARKSAAITARKSTLTERDTAAAHHQMNNMSQYNNTPDEAERLMEELIDVLSDLGDSGLWPKDRIKKLGQMNELRSQLLPLIRSGLALQRLEKAIRSKKYSITSVCVDEDGPWCSIEQYDHDDKTADGTGESIGQAINAALDAAGVE